MAPKVFTRHVTRGLGYRVGGGVKGGNIYQVDIYDDIMFLVNFGLSLYANDRIFITTLYLAIMEGFDMIQQQEQDYVLE